MKTYSLGGHPSGKRPLDGGGWRRQTGNRGDLSFAAESSGELVLRRLAAVAVGAGDEGAERA